MPTVNPHCHHQSASSATAWDKCQTLHRLAYREGIRVAEDTETLRVGSNWHGIHEVYANAYVREMPGNETDYDDEEAELIAKTCAMDAVVRHLNERYATCPRSIDPKDWALERQILLTCFIGYQWYWTNDPIEVLASEVPFDLPLHMPRTGLPLPMEDVKRVGKIDHIIRWQGLVGALERKSTTRDIDPSGDYWDMGKKDIQVSMYALAFQDMGNRPEGFGLGIQLPVETVRSFGNTLYDVWKRPRTKPKWLTQAETAEFIRTGAYMNQQFDAKGERPLIVNGETAEVEQGKKGFSVRETVDMYAARLLAEIMEKPHEFFQRKEIVRTDAELATFRRQLYNRYQTQKYVEKNMLWTENAKACRDPFPCAYIPICYGPGAEAVCDGKTVPNGFKRIFVDLTVNGVEV